MNNSINYSSFIGMLIKSDDEYEPYGLETAPEVHGSSTRQSEYEPMEAALFDKAMGPSRGD